MARRWYFSVFALIGLFMLATQSMPALGENAPPMVEKHIFSPETAEKGTPLEDKKSPAVKQIERKIAFTGVILSPQGRRAMIREKIMRKGKGRTELYKEGDEIASMTLKKIGSNFIVLAGEGKDVKLMLYQGKKKRPAPPALPKVVKTPRTSAGSEFGSSSTTAGKKPVQNPAVQGSAQKPTGAIVRSSAKKPALAPSGKKSAPKPSNPFLEALKKAARKRRESGGATPSATNGFLEAIKGAQQQ